MNGSFSIPGPQTVSGQPFALSRLVHARQGRRLRRARPLLDPLEERCLLNFGSPSLFDNGAGANNAAVAIGDIFGGSYPDGSPILDLVTATTKGGLSISQGYGDGTFHTPIVITTTATSFSTVKLVDLNGKVRLDGSPIMDIVAADPAGDKLWVLMHNGSGTFTMAAPVLLPAGTAPAAMAVAGATANLNGDTMDDLNGHALGEPNFDADIVIANPPGNNVIVLLGNGNGTFQVVQPTESNPLSVAVPEHDVDAGPTGVRRHQIEVAIAIEVADGHAHWT